MAALCLDPLHDAVEVVLHGEFGQIQIGRDLLICQASGDKRHKLALPVSQPQLDTGLLIGHCRSLTGLLGYKLKE